MERMRALLFALLLSATQVYGAPVYNVINLPFPARGVGLTDSGLVLQRDVWSRYALVWSVTGGPVAVYQAGVQFGSAADQIVNVRVNESGQIAMTSIVNYGNGGQKVYIGLGGQVIALPTPPQADPVFDIARMGGISNTGVVVGGLSSGTPAIWRSGSSLELETGVFGSWTGISPNGQNVVGWQWQNGEMVAVRRQAGVQDQQVITGDLAPSPVGTGVFQYDPQVFDINNAGTYVWDSGYVFANTLTVVGTARTEIIPTLSGMKGSRFGGLNDQGQVVGSMYVLATSGMPIQQTAFLWSSELGTIDLGAVTGLPLIEATAINQRGQILAVMAGDTEDTFHTVILDPVPEPSTWLLAGLGLAVGVKLRSKARK